MTNYLTLAIKHVDATPESVIAHRLDAAAGEFVLVVDRGILGSPKYRIPLSALAEFDAPSGYQGDAFEVGVTSDSYHVAPPEAPQDTAVDFSGLTVAELQEIAREREIAYSGLRKAELIEALS